MHLSTEFDEYDNPLTEVLDLFDEKSVQQPIIRSDSEFIDYWNRLNRRQKVVWVYFAFESQVRNGGVYQFFYNTGQFIFAITEAMEELGLKQLLKSYNHALSDYLKKSDRVADIRKDVNNSSVFKDKWESFITGYKEITHTKDVEGYLFERENTKEIYQKIFEYVQTHLSSFARKK